MDRFGRKNKLLEMVLKALPVLSVLVALIGAIYLVNMLVIQKKKIVILEHDEVACPMEAASQMYGQNFALPEQLSDWTLVSIIIALIVMALLGALINLVVMWAKKVAPRFNWERFRPNKIGSQ